MLRIVFLDASTMGSTSLEGLHRFGEVILHPTTAPGQTAGRVRDADIVITNKVMIDCQVLDAASRLRLICVAATGTNNVDLKAAKERGIPVKNAVGYSAASVTQHTFAMVLYLLEQLRFFDEYVKSGGYGRSPIFTHYGHEYWLLNGKQWGIIGLGTIGREVAKVATAFGAGVAYYSTSGRHDDPEYKRLELDELLRTSDVVSVHAPLHDRTKNLLGLDQLKRMKKTALLINVGRGGIVVERDLVQALNEEYLFAAGLDVLEKEPMEDNHPLLSVRRPERLLITPHIAWASKEARETLMDQVEENIRTFLAEAGEQ
jgi:glycerate dehydrogenase